jgi:hypothetical protein
MVAAADAEEARMNAIRLVFVALFLALSSSITPVFGASYSTDQSDLYWADPPNSENGWGFQIVQRGDTIFITMFVYAQASAPTGPPTWYTATMKPSPPGSAIWSGDLYVTSGPPFSAMPYDQGLLTYRKVGTATWTPTSVTTGILAYTVDGVAVTKNAIRQTLVVENYSGHFSGGVHSTATGCANPALNGTTEDVGVLNIVQNGTALTLTELPAKGGNCVFTGTLGQVGQMGSVTGAFSCNDGSYGSFNFVEMQVTEFSVSGRFAASLTVPAGCQASGWFAGLKVTTF